MRSIKFSLILVTLLGYSDKPALAYTYGAIPLEDIHYAAEHYNSCPRLLTKERLVNLMLPPPWWEIVIGTKFDFPPSPMALSRNDNGDGLYPPGQAPAHSPFRRAFWHTGAGTWQLDDKLIGNKGASLSFEKFNTRDAAIAVAKKMSQDYCDSDGSLYYVYSGWCACHSTGTGCSSHETANCEDTFNSLESGLSVQSDYSVDRYGGSEPRTCTIPGQTTPFFCIHVDPPNVQGPSQSIWWINPQDPPDARPPLARPFYVYYQLAKGKQYEWRYWMAADTQFGQDFAARREYGQDSLTSLCWYSTATPNTQQRCQLPPSGLGLCDVTLSRGNCGSNTISVLATLDGEPWPSTPSSGVLGWQLSGSANLSGGGVPTILTEEPAGPYTIHLAGGGPAGASLETVSPAYTQTLTAKGSISFTFKFTTGGFCSSGFSITNKSVTTACGGLLSVNISGSGSGRVLSNPVGIDCTTGTCSTKFPTGFQVLLSPSPSPGSTFGGWSGDPDCLDGIVTINGDRSCTATFTATAAAYVLSVSKTGSGTVSSSDGGINCGGACVHTYVAGTTVTLTASAASGWSFSSWSGDCSGGPAIQLAMTSNRTCTADFVQTGGMSPETTTGSATSIDATSATLNGTVNPHGLATTAFFEYGPDPFLGSATPGLGFGNGNSFLSFSQPVTGLACATTYRFRAVGVSAGGDYIASNNTFKTSDCPPAPCYVLTLTQNGDGAVPVAAPPNSSGCPFGQYHSGEHITLTASAGPGNIVIGWGDTDNDHSTSTVNTVTMPSFNWLAFVSYGHICYHLSLGYTGQGAAPVATNPVASCPADYFPWGYEVRVESSPATGWKIGGWSGTNNDTTTSPFNFIMMPIGNTAALVQYIPLQYLVQITKNGNGEGTIVSDLPGINCGPTCTASYPFGSTVTLTAAAAPGSSFGGWSDQCAGGVVTIDGVGTSKNCTATFTADPLQEWVVERAGGKTLLGIYFLDENEGWAVGAGGTILHTTNGGTTWQQQISPSPYYQYNAVYFANHDIGWAAGLGGGDGNGGVIVHTTDGGATWSVQYDGGSSTSSRVWWLAGVDQNRLWAATSSGLLWSTDGGMNWQLRPMSPLWRVRFADAAKGWASTQSGQILKSEDGGVTWVTAYTPPNGGIVLDLGLAGSKVWGVGALANLKIVDTLDGVQWQEQSSGTTDILRSSSFLDACTGWAVGGGGTILKTINGGTNWTGSIISSSLYDVFFTRLGGWAVGQGGVVLKYVKPISSGPSLVFRNSQFDSSGGDGIIDITVPAGCGWGAVSKSPDFITITSGATGGGNGRVTYHVAPNSGLPRHGTVDVAGVKFSIDQAGVSCNAVLSPPTGSFGVTGGTGTFSISTQSGCSWTARTDAQWITITQGSGTGSGTVSFTLQGNPDPKPRSATIGVSGAVFTAYQAGSATVGEALKFYTITPCRVYDSRPSSQLVSGAKRYLQVTGICGVPPTAKAISANVSVTAPTGGGFVTIWPADLGVPGTSIINFAGSQTRANNTILLLATDGVGDLAGLASVQNSGSVHLILDVNGYFQ